MYAWQYSNLVNIRIVMDDSQKYICLGCVPVYSVFVDLAWIPGTCEFNHLPQNPTHTNLKTLAQTIDILQY